jgi:cyclase
MRRVVLFIGFMAVLGVSIAVVPGLTQQQQHPPLTLEKVKDDLYVIVGNGGNVAALVTNEGVILVDDKFEQDYDAITQHLRTVTNQPVKYVFNTHYHSDHSGGNTRFLAIAEIISHKNSRTNILENKQSNLARSGPRAALNMRPARIVFTDETSLFLGGKEVRARYFGRGHTNGDIVIYFPAQRVIHTGDLMALQTPLIDYSGGGSIIEWSKTVDAAVAAFDFDTVIPGHGAVTNNAGLQNYRDNVAKLRTEVSALIRQGKTQAEIRSFLAEQYPAAYGDVNSLWNQWSVPGFMTELK